MLPGKNGEEVIKDIKALKQVPVIIVSAKDGIDSKVELLRSGADDYLTKPFDARELLARIRARIRSAAEISENVLSAFDISIDISTYQLKKGDKAIKLSKTEFEMLECLMMNKGQILPKNTIINKVWGFDETGDYNNLEVYVSFLRKKLKFVGAKACIVTQKGVGYSLSAEGK